MKRQNWNDAVGIDDDIRALRHGSGLGDTMWKYEQLRAGRVYAKFMFNSREEAEDFASQMSKVEPDLFSRIEPVAAKAIWN